MSTYLFTQFFKLFGFYRSNFYLKLYWPTVAGLFLILSQTAFAAVPKFDPTLVAQQLDWAGAGFIIIALWFIDTILGFLRGWMTNQVDEHRLQQGIGKLILWFAVIGLCMLIRLSGAKWSLLGIPGSEMMATTLEILVAVTEALSILRTVGELSGNPTLQKWCSKLADTAQSSIDSRLNTITHNQEVIKQAINEVVPLPPDEQIHDSKLLNP